MEKKTVIGSDHAGLALKLKIIEHLEKCGYTVEDVGTHDSSSCHYPVFAHAVCEKIQSGEYPLGILVCGTGIGMSMVANKHPGIRAAACENTFSARATRMHNDANILCLGERVIGPGLACDMVDIFLETAFEGGRHQTRVDMMENWSK